MPDKDRDVFEPDSVVAEGLFLRPKNTRKGVPREGEQMRFMKWLSTLRGDWIDEALAEISAKREKACKSAERLMETPTEMNGEEYWFTCPIPKKKNHANHEGTA
jgi:hypothetical protein